MESGKTVFVKVFGKVQGIGFRWSAYEKFVELDLKGKAENAQDDTIKITVSGEVERLKEFLRWAQKGPSGAKVSKMDYHTVEETVSEDTAENKKPEEEE
jgi:acylphosphatase